MCLVWGFVDPVQTINIGATLAAVQSTTITTVHIYIIMYYMYYILYVLCIYYYILYVLCYNLRTKRLPISDRSGFFRGPTILEKPIIRQNEDGSILLFECRMTTETEPAITWFHNDGRVKQGARHNISMKKEENDTYLCTLEVSNPTRNDAGKYQIKARNDDGESTATVISYFG